MKKGNVYMHKSAMDVCIEVIDKESHFVRVNWWNLGYTGNPWLIDFDDIIIYPHQEINWVDITTVWKNKRSKPGLEGLLNESK